MTFQARKETVTYLVCDRCKEVSEFYVAGEKRNPNYVRRIGRADYGWIAVRRVVRIRDVCPACQGDP